MNSEAMFVDGPLIGSTKKFDRATPPAKLYHQRPIIDPHSSLDAPKRFEPVTYRLEPNIFGTSPEWLYMLEESLEAADSANSQ